MKKTQVLELISKQFEPVKNDKGETIRFAFTLDAIQEKSALHEKLSDLIRNADVDEDSAYGWILEAVDSLNDYSTNIEPGRLDEEEDDKIRDYISECADSNIPIYNSELLEWLGKGTNYTIVDDAIDEFGWDKERGITGAIMTGYYMAWERQALALWDLIEELAE